MRRAIGLFVLLLLGSCESAKRLAVPRDDRDASEPAPDSGAEDATVTADAGAKTDAAIGDITPYPGPAMLPPMPSIVSIDTGAAKCAVLSDGALRCWGSLTPYPEREAAKTNLPFRLGKVAIGGPVRAVSVGSTHACALMVNGEVRCWGDPMRNGSLGYGDTRVIGDDEYPSEAGAVKLTEPAKQVAATGLAHTCALLESGKVACWGKLYEDVSALGDDEYPLEEAVIRDLPRDEPVKSIVTGDAHTCALYESGAVSCWGQPLPSGYVVEKNLWPPTAPTLPIGALVKQVAAGANHTCVVLVDGRLRCWGLNAAGQLGYGTTRNMGFDDLEHPETQPGDVDVGGVVQQIALRGDHTCALLDDGRVRCWGAKGSELGIPEASTRNIGDMQTPATFGRSLDLGGKAKFLAPACAILQDGTLRCWGPEAGYKLDYMMQSVVGDDETPASMGPVQLFYQYKDN